MNDEKNVKNAVAINMNAKTQQNATKQLITTIGITVSAL